MTSPFPPGGHFGAKPSPEALGNMGLQALTQVPAHGAAVAGSFTTGVICLRDAIMGGDRRPAVVALFVDSLQRLRDIPEGWNVADALVAALQSGFVLPHVAMRPALLVLQTNPVFAHAFALADRGDHAGVTRLFDQGLLPALRHPLLMTLLQASVVSGPELEFVLTALRRHFLARVIQGGREPLDLAQRLAAQCFLNEYAFARNVNEIRDVTRLAATSPSDPFTVAVLASYDSLGAYPWATSLTPALAGPLLAQQVAEPAAERAIAASIETLKAITAPVSQVVRNLYEENPYPRWTAPLRVPVRETAEIFRQKYLNADFTYLDTVTTPDILVAGCGTGLNLLMTVGGYRTWRVTAVDLSRASLAHARRQLDAFGIPDVRLLQADILDLGALPQTFDVIEAAGVLHHMADPLQGWKVLSEKLRPGGIMHIALYSTIARRGIDKVRAFAKARGYPSTRDGIVQFRSDALTILRTPGHPDRAMMEEAGLASWHDFFSTSGCRDLIFHPQEVAYTVPEIARMIGDVGLTFRGFSFPSPAFLNAYRQRFPADPAGLDLNNWDRFEQENPSLFIRMYTFIVQKPL